MYGVGMAVAPEKRISPEIKLSIKFTEGRDGYIVAECPDVPGCVSQGKTREEALENLEDVIRTCLALMVRRWIKEAKKGHSPTANQHESDEMVLTFTRAKVA